MWGDVGMTGEWATKPISLYGRNSISGTYEFFKQTVLYGGDFKESVKQQPGSEAVVENVANDKFAIGYSGLGYKTDGVRTVPLAAFYGKECYDTTSAATYSGMRFVCRNTSRAITGSCYAVQTVLLLCFYGHFKTPVRRECRLRLRGVFPAALSFAVNLCVFDLPENKDQPSYTVG
jgi:hypothetical protein